MDINITKTTLNLTYHDRLSHSEIVIEFPTVYYSFSSILW